MKIIHKNKKAYFDYEVLKEYVAGMMLTGPEIKSIRKGNINLKGAFVTFHNGAPYLKNCHISKYAYDNNASYDPFRLRKLLLKEEEIRKIQNHLNTAGVTIVPLAVGLKGRYAKLEIGVVRGKKQHDKRENIKQKDIKRRTDQMLKQYK